MRDPARRASHREHAGKRSRGKAERLEQQRGVELDVGLERPVGLAAPQQMRAPPPRPPPRAPAAPPCGGARPRQRAKGRFQRVGTRVAHPVDAVPEAHQAVARSSAAASQASRVSGVPIASSISMTGSGRAAVQRAFQRAKPARTAEDEARARRCHDPGREGGRVEAVIRDRDEIGVEPTRPFRRGLPSQHPQDIGRMVGVRIGRDGRQPHSRTEHRRR